MISLDTSAIMAPSESRGQHACVMIARVWRWVISADARPSANTTRVEAGVVVLRTHSFAALIVGAASRSAQPRFVALAQSAVVAEAALVGASALDDELRLLMQRLASRLRTVARGERRDVAAKLAGASTVLFLARDHEFAIAHVGINRALLVRDRSVTSLTDCHDHRCMITNDFANRPELRWSFTPPFSGQLVVNSIGSVPLEIDTALAEWRHDDRVVLCSPFVFARIKDDEIASLVGSRTASDAVDALLHRAIERGADREVSAVVAHVQRIAP